jgi:hypothetical protein
MFNRLYAIYDKVVHEATCDKSYKGLTWSFISFLVIAFSGMMMLTFRSVLYPVAGVDNRDEYSWNQAKEQEALQEAPASNDGDDFGDEGENKWYTVNTGVESVTQPMPPYRPRCSGPTV